MIPPHDPMKPSLLKPPSLRPGGKIGIIAPASPARADALQAGCAQLRQMGYEPVYSSGILERDLYFAGSVDRRLQELRDMLARDDVAALVCARGGYGCNHLLENIPFDEFSRHPKIFMGYSDVTSLLTAIADRTGLVTFHGPMVAKDFATAGGVEFSSWDHALQGSSGWSIPTSGAEVLRPGQAQGRLYGGCLSLLVASLGTPFEIQTEGTILFMEDIAAKPYQVDRMLMQLRLAGKLEPVKGMIFGEMFDCVQPGGQEYTLQEAILRVCENFSGPIVYGVRSGHVSGGNITLPIGVRAELTAANSQAILKIQEAATLKQGVEGV